MSRDALVRARVFADSVKEGLKGDSEIFRHVFKYPRERMIADMVMMLGVALLFTLILPVVIYFKYGLDFVDFILFWLGFYILLIVFLAYIVISTHREKPEWVILLVTGRYLIFFHSSDRNHNVLARSAEGDLDPNRYLRIEQIVGVRKESTFLLRMLGGRKDLASFTFTIKMPGGQILWSMEWIIPLEASEGFFRRLYEINPRIKMEPALRGANV
jgi:hypothetical protein